MRYRVLDETGDYTFGRGRSGFLENSPETVVQAVKTRLGLIEGEWFLDLTEGTPYMTQILGKGTDSLYDRAVKERISGTQGLSGIRSYFSTLKERNLTIGADIDTVYGVAEL